MLFTVQLIVLPLCYNVSCEQGNGVMISELERMEQIAYEQGIALLSGPLPQHTLQPAPLSFTVRLLPFAGEVLSAGAHARVELESL